MRNLVKYVGIGLLVMGLAACDNSDTKAPAEVLPQKVAPADNRSACWTANSVFPASGYDRSERQAGHPCEQYARLF